MAHYILYNKISGDIVATGSCPNGEELNRAAGGHDVMIMPAGFNHHEFRSGHYKVRNGEIVETNTAVLDMVGLRHVRNNLLEKTDWTQLPDAPLSDQDRLAFRDYRQKLRDLPAVVGDLIAKGANPTDARSLFPPHPKSALVAKNPAPNTTISKKRS